jgi:hypothetical protein
MHLKQKYFVKLKQIYIATELPFVLNLGSKCSDVICVVKLMNQSKTCNFFKTFGKGDMSYHLSTNFYYFIFFLFLSHEGGVCSENIKS